MSDMQRLLVVSHVLHYEHEGRLFAYGPYAREIDIWAELFPKIVIAAPVHRAPPPGDALAFQHANISIAPQRETGGTTLLPKVTQMLAIPGHLWRLARAMQRADAIQVRCPGNLGLLGCILAPCFRKPRVAKYASQWSEFPGEPFSWRLQKRLLRSRWWRAPVLVYGKWPNQPPHIIPFFTSILSESQMARTRASGPRNWSRRPLVALFVGRLSQAKNVHVIIRALADLRRSGDEFQLRIVGDGPMREELEALVRTLNLGAQVVFEGAVPQGRVLDYYEQAHILVLASQTEGWPKAIAEAMAFGLVCIGSDRGLVPQMLGEGRGLLVQPGDVSGLARALHSIAMGPLEAMEMSNRSANWARQFTLEGLREAIRKQLESSWAVSLPDVSAPAPQSSQAIAP
jgi:glycosyltransferase involved in cell wall biosynthesis